MQHTVDQSTLDTKKTLNRQGRRRFVGLSILCHPDLARIGHRAPLFDPGQSGELQLSRSEPLFRSAQGAEAAPLSTQRVSRLPVTLDVQDNGEVRFRAASGGELWVDGVRVERELRCDAERVERGLRVQLGKYVLLELALQDSAPLGRPVLPELIGQSPAMRELKDEIARVSDLELSVLLRGESGVGKELVAAALHRQSPRRAGPYVCVNMAAIPASVAAAELFGHARGAFTGATAAREGYFVAADGGSLFLDEIGQTPADVQSVLLRVLESGVIQPLGGQLRQVSVRLLAATDSDLEAAVVQGKFSQALLRRFGYEIRLPPLRERGGDIPELFAHFLSEELGALGEQQRLEVEHSDRDPFLTAQVVEQLMAYPWPGNVRELRSAARRFAIHNRGRTRVERDAWLQSVLKSTPPPASPSEAPPKREREPRHLSDEEIAQALEACDFGIERAARELGVSRSWLHTRIDGIASLRKAKDLGLTEIRAALASAEGDLGRAALALRVSLKGLQLQMTRLGLGGKRAK